MLEPRLPPTRRCFSDVGLTFAGKLEQMLSRHVQGNWSNCWSPSFLPLANASQVCFRRSSTCFVTMKYLITQHMKKNVAIGLKLRSLNPCWHETQELVQLMVNCPGCSEPFPQQWRLTRHLLDVSLRQHDDGEWLADNHEPCQIDIRRQKYGKVRDRSTASLAICLGTLQLLAKIRCAC